VLLRKTLREKSLRELPSNVAAAPEGALRFCRKSFNEIAKDESRPMEERFKARLKLAKLPRNSAPNRMHNRCQLTGRPHAYYRKLKVSRIALRELGSSGLIPGLVKSSW
jgi:small subunit ribosomal protein S14